MEAAENLEDINAIQIYRLHALKGKREGQFALDLGKRLGYRLIIIPLDEKGNEQAEKDIQVLYKSTKIIFRNEQNTLIFE